MKRHSNGHLFILYATSPLHCYSLRPQRQHPRLRAGELALSVRGCRSWNSLPGTLAQAGGKGAFKTRLDQLGKVQYSDALFETPLIATWHQTL